MFTILDTVCDTALATTRFACDLGACKGACCTMPGGRGAPLDDAEVELVEAAIPVASRYLPPEKLRTIEVLGAIEGHPDDYATRCIGGRDCVFVYYEGEVAKCAIERAYFNGETSFRKPISCHLFPIRVNRLFEADYLHYERIPECDAALENGRRQDIPLYRFLKDALVRAYGQQFYRELARTIEKRYGTKKGT